MFVGAASPTRQVDGDLWFDPSDADPSTALVPPGGVTKQVLSKNTSADGDTSWRTLLELPVGGTLGQVLVKQSTTDGNAQWMDQTYESDGLLTIGSPFSQLTGFDQPAYHQRGSLVTAVGTITGPNTGTVASGTVILSGFPIPVSSQVMFFKAIRCSGSLTLWDFRLNSSGQLINNGALTAPSWFPLGGISYEAVTP